MEINPVHISRHCEDTMHSNAHDHTSWQHVSGWMAITRIMFKRNLIMTSHLAKGTMCKQDAFFQHCRQHKRWHAYFTSNRQSVFIFLTENRNRINSPFTVCLSGSYVDKIHFFFIYWDAVIKLLKQLYKIDINRIYTVYWKGKRENSIYWCLP